MAHQLQHRIGSGAAVFVLGLIAVASLTLLRRSEQHVQTISTSIAACGSLPGLAQQLCSSYHTAVGSDKFTAAVHWRQLSPTTYACSGITVDCLQDDMLSSSSNSSSSSSSCRPLPDGAVCEVQQQQQQRLQQHQQQQHQMTCRRGACGGRLSDIPPADPAFQPGLSSGFAPVSFAAPQQQQQQQQQAPQSRCMLRRAAALLRAWLASAAATTTAAVESTTAADESATAAEPHPRFLQAVGAQVDPNWPTAVGSIRFKEGARRVPETFLATSHEWTRLTDYGGDSAPAWAEIFRVLSPSPVLRIGGATQDKLIDPPKDDTWIALAQLQKLTNARFIIGLPLFQKNAVEMSRQMIGRAKKYLGSAVIGYELGNEPEFWPNGLGGYDEQGNWKPGFEPYAKWFDRVARTLNPCGTTPFLSGPGWGNLNTQDPAWLKQVLATGTKCGYLWEANSHYYPYIDNATVTEDQLLSQSLQDVGLYRLKQYVYAAWSGHNLALRISEANSLYGGGRAGLSDTMAGTLWVTDALFAFAFNGARAFHLHWGLGGLPYEGGSPNVGVQTNFDYNTPYPFKPYPSVHAPWYGYLFWVYATAGGYSRNADTQFVGATLDMTGKAAISSSSAAASVVTEKGTKNATSSSTSSNKRLPSPAAMQAYSTESKPPSSSNALLSSTPNSLRAFARQFQLQGLLDSQAALQSLSPQRHTAAAAAGGGVKHQPLASARVPQKVVAAAVQQQQGRKLAAASAVQQNSTTRCEANMKLWALKSGDNTLRVAVLNKDSKRDCNIRVVLTDAPHLCKRGELSRLLPGPQGMSSKGGVSWQGQHYEDASVAVSGKLVGDKATAAIAPTRDADGCSFTFGMPKASAALLIVTA